MRIRPDRYRLTGVFLGLLTACSSSPVVTPGEPPRPLRADTLEHNGWDRDCDLLHVFLDLEFDHEQGRVWGSAMHRMRGIRRAVDELQLHAVGLEIEQVVDDRGNVLEYASEDPLLTIQLVEPLLLGAEVSVTVTYSATPKKGLYFRKSSKDFEGPAPQVWSQGQAEDHRFWIPIWDYPNDRTTFSAKFRVTDGLIALSNGELLDVAEHEDGSRTYHWQLEQSLPTYLIALAAGRWENYTDDWQGVPVEYWVAPGTGEEKARRAFGETPAMLTYFSELLGVDYPYSKYAQVAVSKFVAGGMENTSLTIQNDYVICSASGDAELDGETRLLVAHELAHQWFGDLVTCFGWSHLWLNEAWASYLEVLFEGHVLGSETMALRLERYRRSYLRRGDRTRRPLSEDFRTQLTNGRCSHEYVKGPWVLAMLERELGSEDFWRATQHYLERHAEGLVTTEDFQQAIFESTGRNVEGFLEQWVECGGHPEYEVEFEARVGEAGPQLLLTVRQVQRTSELVPLFDVRVDVDLWDDRGRVRESLRVSQTSEVFVLPLSGKLKDLQFDATSSVLCDLKLNKPTEMWIEQGRSPAAAQRFRALKPLQVARDRGHRGARDVLAEIAQEDPEVYLRRSAVAGFNRAQHVPFLLRCLDREQDHLARVELLELLSRRPLGKSTVGSLEEVFAGSESKRVDKALERLRTALEKRGLGTP